MGKKEGKKKKAGKGLVQISCDDKPGNTSIKNGSCFGIVKKGARDAGA